jgi:hypothetical protein
LKGNYTDLTQVLMTLDKLFAAFDKSDDNDWFRLCFIDCIIDLCFQQGISQKFSF